MLCYHGIAMAKIVIDIPSGEDRQYVLDDIKQAKLFLSALDISAIRITNNKASVAELEDAVDLRNVKKAVSEFRRTGKSRRWKDAKADLEL